MSKIVKNVHKKQKTINLASGALKYGQEGEATDAEYSMLHEHLEAEEVKEAEEVEEVKKPVPTKAK